MNHTESVFSTHGLEVRKEARDAGIKLLSEEEFLKDRQERRESIAEGRKLLDDAPWPKACIGKRRNLLTTPEEKTRLLAIGARAKDNVVMEYHRRVGGDDIQMYGLLWGNNKWIWYDALVAIEYPYIDWKAILNESGEWKEILER